MAFLKRTVMKPTEESVFTCDYSWRAEAGNILFCSSEAFDRDSPPSNWGVVQIINEPPRGTQGNLKILHFCPEHAQHVESRLARILAP
jgi:hypothetical protein